MELAMAVYVPNTNNRPLMDTNNLTLQRSKSMVDLTVKDYVKVCTANHSTHVGLATIHLHNPTDKVEVAFVNPATVLEDRLIMSRSVNCKRKISILVDDGDHIRITKDWAAGFEAGTTQTYKTEVFRANVVTRNSSARVNTTLTSVGEIPLINSTVIPTEILASTTRSIYRQSFSKMINGIFGKDLVTDTSSSRGGIPMVRMYKESEKYSPKDVMFNIDSSLTYGYNVDDGELRFKILTLKEADLSMRRPQESAFDGLAQIPTQRPHSIHFWSFNGAEDEIDAAIIKRLKGAGLLIHADSANLTPIYRKQITGLVRPDSRLIKIV